MKTMDNVKKRIITSMISILLLIITLFGITYAYFVTRVKGNEEEKSISVTTGKLELLYGDGNGILDVGEYLSPGNIVKFKNAKGEIVEYKTFTVRNTGTAKIDSYEVVLENVINELINYEDLTYTLTCSSTDDVICNGSSGVFPKNNAILVTNSINEEVTHSYVLSLYYNDTHKDQSHDMNKTISAKINIEDNEHNLKKLLVYGNSIQNGTPSTNKPVEIKSVGDITKNLFSGLTIGKNISLTTGLEYDSIDGAVTDFIPIDEVKTYILSGGENGKIYNRVYAYNSNYEYIGSSQETSDFVGMEIAKGMFVTNIQDIADTTIKYIRLNFYKNSSLENGADIDIVNEWQLQLEEGNTVTEYEPYNKYKLPITVVGKNRIPTYSNSTKNGITLEVNDDGSVHIYGTATANTDFYSDYFTLMPDVYYLSGCDSGCSTSTYGILAYFSDVNYNLADYGDGASYKLIQNSRVRAQIRVYENAVVDTTLKPMLEVNSLRTNYEPYRIPSSFNIYLNEPLRKVGEVADYVDFANNKVVRNVEVVDNSGTLNVDESLKVLDTSKEEPLDLPDLSIFSDKYSIQVLSEINPSKIEY